MQRTLSQGCGLCICFQTFMQRTLSQGCSLFICFRTFMQRTLSQGCSLFIKFPNLSPVDYQQGVQPVHTLFKPSSRKLSFSVAACFKGFCTYLPGTVGQGCNLFKWIPSLPPGDCQPVVQPVYMVSQPTSRGLSARAAACLYVFQNLPQGDCWPELWTVYGVSEITYKGLSASDAACFYGF